MSICIRLTFSSSKNIDNSLVKSVLKNVSNYYGNLRKVNKELCKLKNKIIDNGGAWVDFKLMCAKFEVFESLESLEESYNSFYIELNDWCEEFVVEILDVFKNIGVRSCEVGISYDGENEDKVYLINDEGIVEEIYFNNNESDFFCEDGIKKSTGNLAKGEIERFILSDNVKMFNQFIETEGGVNANILSDEDEEKSLLMLACEYGSSRIIKKLINEGVDVNWKNDKYNDAYISLLTSNSNDKINNLKELFNTGLQLYQWHKLTGNSVIYKLVIDSRIYKKNVLKFLVDQGIGVNMPNIPDDHLTENFNEIPWYEVSQITTPLMGAVLFGNLEAVRDLIELGANVNSVNYLFECTALDCLKELVLNSLQLPENEFHKLKSDIRTCLLENGAKKYEELKANNVVK
ncbi:ankyrin repeat domain-containing protein [Zooshikella harenae]|uniref:Ankyrin repeat domain-containing protein n=1 Tax=Zooshikella harenae TaxID=2827238 RepID=A0ABS5ZJ91_9GAMM|nr:ankyrin repeat domain-containing protein [Zooshikella harenae]MBU2713953.1 hypothetical protein [Zooshikella harenae]